jgi:hypothetical protein
VKFYALILAAGLGSVAFAAEPAPHYVDRTKPVEICGLSASSLDQVANALVDRGGVREAAGDQKFLAYEALDRTHIWTFTRKGHAAHPAVVCRELKDGAAGLEVGMQFVCGGNPAPCAALYREVVALNEQMRAKTRKPPS